MRDVNAEIIATAFRRIIFNNVLHSSALNAVLILETPAVREAVQSGMHTELWLSGLLHTARACSPRRRRRPVTARLGLKT